MLTKKNIWQLVETQLRKPVIEKETFNFKDYYGIMKNLNFRLSILNLTGIPFVLNFREKTYACDFL